MEGKIVIYNGIEYKVYGMTYSGKLIIKPVYNIFKQDYVAVDENEVKIKDE